MILGPELDANAYGCWIDNRGVDVVHVEHRFRTLCPFIGNEN